MATHDNHPDTNPENKYTPNPHEHPQNTSGKAGKELSSDQDKPEFDQSEENESLEQQKAHLHQHHENSAQPQNVQDPKRPEVPGTTGVEGLHPSSKDPVDRPLKDENGELI